MNRNDKIAVLTLIRSEYGLLLPLLKLMKSDGYFDLRVIAGGAHLLPEFGNTIAEVHADGFVPDALFPFLSTGNGQTITDSMSLLLKQAGDYLSTSKPDLLVVLGDRFELLPVVSAALVLNIPIAHISGGDVTEGAIDNQVRHAITKMAALHFPATQEYKQNIMKMGEEEWRICVAGEPGLDEVLNMQYLPKKELFADLGLNIGMPVALCTFHPETIENEITPAFVKEVLESIADTGEYQALVTAANFDTGGREINSVLEELEASHKRIRFVKSLGQKRYYSLLRYASVVLGNSSSGLTEVQSFNIPVINVGKRQAGRLANPNVYNVVPAVKPVLDALQFVATSAFREQYYGKSNIYGDGRAADRIYAFLKNTDKKRLLLKKSIF